MRNVRAGDAVVDVVERMMMERAPPFSPRSRPSQSRMIVVKDSSAVMAIETEAPLSQSIGA